MSNLSAFKKRWIEKWCLTVNPFLLDGSMCTMTGVYHEEDPHLIAKNGATCCVMGQTPRNLDVFETGKLAINGERLVDAKLDLLPSVKLSYSHLSRRKFDRLMNGLPVIYSGGGDTPEEKLSPVTLTQQPQTDNRHLYRRQTTDSPNLKSCEISVIHPSSPTSKHRNAFAPNRTVSRARQKLLQKSTPSYKSRQLENYIPIQNCWTR
ncbi:hypothetical protein SNE40_013981 [Patella caerulea]|uniref:Uncharacterized protein n=1 Tax=Patella caerulea TaxID=87958 RepID=A0AAN8JJB3_PATCE